MIKRRRTTFTKATRAKVHAKCSGHCAYCGVPIADHQMHIDHVVARHCGGSNLIENLLPACLPCNRLKGVWTVEEFRAELGEQANRCRRYNANFRTAERFGLVKVVVMLPVVFYFEREPVQTQLPRPMCGGYSVTA